LKDWGRYGRRRPAEFQGFIFTDEDLSEAVHNGPDAECRSSHGDRQGKEAGLAAAAFGSDFGLALGELGCFFSGDLSCRHV